MILGLQARNHWNCQARIWASLDFTSMVRLGHVKLRLRLLRTRGPLVYACGWKTSCWDTMRSHQVNKPPSGIFRWMARRLPCLFGFKKYLIGGSIAESGMSTVPWDPSCSGKFFALSKNRRRIDSTTTNRNSTSGLLSVEATARYAYWVPSMLPRAVEKGRSKTGEGITSIHKTALRRQVACGRV